MMGWWGCGGGRLKVDEGVRLKASECVRMLVDGLVGLWGVRLKVDESTSLKVGEGVRMLVDGLVSLWRREAES